MILAANMQLGVCLSVAGVGLLLRAATANHSLCRIHIVIPVVNAHHDYVLHLTSAHTSAVGSASRNRFCLGGNRSPEIITLKLRIGELSQRLNELPISGIDRILGAF